MSNLSQFLADLTTLLTQSEVEYMITGSFASTYYSEPRSTVDIDIVATASTANLVAFVRSLDSKRFHFPSEESVISDTQFNVIETSTGWKLDVMTRKDRPFSVMEFSRRRPVNLLGIDTFIASPEDIILAKLEWASTSESERQLRDIKSILEIQREVLDFSYLRHWAADLKVSDQLEAAISRLN